MPAEKWNFDPVHSHIAFSVRHLMISKVTGHFKSWTGTLLIDDDQPENSRIDVEIEAATIDTKEPQRDDHLRSPDFLDVEKYPSASFNSRKVEVIGDDRYRVTGDLTLHGISKPLVLDVTYEGAGKDPWGGERAGFVATTAIDRKDFGLVWNKALETGGVLVGDKVELTLEIEAVKQAAQVAA